MFLTKLTRLAASSLAVSALFTGAALSQSLGGFGEEDDGGDWDFFLGAGVAYEPEFEGSDRYETNALPALQIVWRDRILLTPEGLGAFIVSQERYRISAAVGYGGGRDEDDSDYLRGLGDIDDGAVLSLGAQYDLGFAIATADVRKFLDGSEGTLVTLGLQSEVPFGVVRGALVPTGTNPRDAFNERGLLLTGGVSVDWADGDYNQAFFGVDAAQSTSSGLRQFSAGSGVKSVNVDLGFAKPLGRNWGLTGGVTYSRLLGDAADSPIVQTEDSVSATLAVGFSF